jgi:transcriptional regulator with XRE-family HTH domain
MVESKHPGARRPDIDRHVARRMRERRVVLGLSQQQLAERIGFTFQQIHKYENGINRIAAGVLERIARTLGVGPEFFYEGLGDASAQSDRPRALLSLAQDFTKLDTGKQRALLSLSRTLADMDIDDATDPDTTT